MPDKREYIWIVTLVDPDPGRHSVAAYRTEKAAEEAAAGWAASLAQGEIDGFVWDEDEPVLDTLNSVVANYEAGKFRAALDDWYEYADDKTPDQNVSVDQVEIVG